MTDFAENKPREQLLGVDDAISEVQNIIKERLITSPMVIRSFTKHLAKTRGKNIRACSLISCAQNADGAVRHDALLLAAAVELLHLATLVHDDVIDDAETRRGEQTIQAKFGKRGAVICGDYLFCLALQTASEISQGSNSELSSLLPDYMTKVCLGELMQNQNNRNFNLTAVQYYKIISGKTAALFEASFYGGFMLSGEDKSRSEQYKRLGHHIGMIFQLTDDCADYEHSYEQTKKPVKSDFEQGVITLPLIHAFKAKQGLRANAQAGMSAAAIVEAVRDAGGLLYTRSIIKKHYIKAMQIIDSLNITAEKRERLGQILKKSTNGIDISIKRKDNE